MQRVGIESDLGRNPSRKMRSFITVDLPLAGYKVWVLLDLNT